MVSYINAHIITPHIIEYAIFKQQNSMISIAIARNLARLFDRLGLVRKFLRKIKIQLTLSALR